MSVIYGKFPNLKKFFQTLVEYIASSMQVISVMQFGDIALDDFSPKYSKIDVIVILEKSLWEKDFDLIDDIMSKIQQTYPDYSSNLNLYFIPSQLIENPRISYQDFEGMIVTSDNQVLISKYPFTATKDFQIRKYAETLYGNDYKETFPIPPTDCFWMDFVKGLEELEKNVKEYPFQLSNDTSDEKAINILLNLTQTIYSLKNNDFIGKTKGAYWFANEYPSDLGDFILEVGLSRLRNTSTSNIISLVEKSRDFFLFFIEKVFQIRGMKTPDFKKTVKISDSTHDFTFVFMEIRNLLQ